MCSARVHGVSSSGGNGAPQPDPQMLWSEYLNYSLSTPHLLPAICQELHCPGGQFMQQENEDSISNPHPTPTQALIGIK